MSRRIHFILLFLTLLLISSCAAKRPYNHIEKDARKHFNAVETYLIMHQSSIGADINEVDTSKTVGGGLLFTMIDAAVNNLKTKGAEKLIQPIQENLADYDYAEKLADEIGLKLKEVEWLKTKDIVVERSADKNYFESKVKTSNASAVMFMTAGYKFTPNMDRVVTTIKVLMFPNIDDLGRYKEKENNNSNPVDVNNNIYRKEFSYLKPLPVPGKKKQNVEVLVQNNSEILKHALSESARDIAIQIYDDITQDEEV